MRGQVYHSPTPPYRHTIHAPESTSAHEVPPSVRVHTLQITSSVPPEEHADGVPPSTPHHTTPHTTLTPQISSSASPLGRPLNSPPSPPPTHPYRPRSPPRRLFFLSRPPAALGLRYPPTRSGAWIKADDVPCSLSRVRSRARAPPHACPKHLGMYCVCM